MPKAHYRVIMRTEKLDEGGHVADVVSEDILADFPDDQTDDTEGEQSNNFHNDILMKIGRV